MAPLVLEPYYLPPVGWWALALSADYVLLPTDIRYRKQTLFNRCWVKGPNRVQALTATVVKGRRQPPLPEVRLSYADDWVRLHTGTLVTAYRATPFYANVVPDILAHLATRPDTLLGLTLPLVRLLAGHLGLQARLEVVATPPVGCSPETLDDRTPHPGLHPVPYYQPFGPFAPGLSVLDLLCNTGPQAAAVLWAMAGQNSV